VGGDGELEESLQVGFLVVHSPFFVLKVILIIVFTSFLSLLFKSFSRAGSLTLIIHGFTNCRPEILVNSIGGC
jgi:hypothetical protein